MQKEETHGSSISSASLIDLKAELFRKQEEFKAVKQKNSGSDYVKGKSSASTSSKKLNIWKKSNAGVAKRAEKDYEEKLEEEDAFERSKRKLETKAKLYEQITKGTDFPEEDGGGQFLVDFQQKVIDEEAEKRKKARRQERYGISEEEAFRKQLYQPVPPAEENKNGTAVTSRTLLSDDMRREQERERWEQEEESMQEQKPVHYADVLHNEIRTHGVGFYKFDTDESVRQEQLEELDKLREKTKDERSKSDRIKEKRKAALAARLAKVKQRKREKAGLPPLGSDDDKSSGDEIGPQPVQEPAVVEPLTRDDSWRQSIQSTREWDKDKEYMLQKSEQAWLEKQRSEREDEFAPPSFYYQDNSNRKGGIKPRLPSSVDNDSKHSTLADSSSNVIHEASHQCDLGQTSNPTSTHTKTNLDEEKQRHESEQLSSVCGNEQTTFIHHASQGSSHMQTTSVCGREQTTSSFTNHASQGSSHMHLSNVVSSVISGLIGDKSIVSSVDGVNMPSQESHGPPPNVYAQPPDTSYPHYDVNTPPINMNIPPPPPPNENLPTANMNVPPPNINNQVPYVNTALPYMNVPPPNMNNPPSDASVPIADMSIPPPNVTVPPPNLNVPPPNLNVPPPNLNIPPPNLNIAPTDIAVTSGAMNPAAADTHAVPTAAGVSMPKTKFVPKLSIVDTRLMAGEDD